MLCRADSVGVFQVGAGRRWDCSPGCARQFYDLVIEIALIRPGPIQGGAVHPFMRRKTGQEEVTYLHPKLKPVLERTLGVPLFQEQLMQMAHGRRRTAPARTPTCCAGRWVPSAASSGSTR